MNDPGEQLRMAAERLRRHEIANPPPFTEVIRRSRHRRMTFGVCVVAVLLVGAVWSTRGASSDQRVISNSPDTTTPRADTTSVPVVSTTRANPLATSAPPSASTSPTSGTQRPSVSTSTATSPSPDPVCGDPTALVRRVVDAWTSGVGNGRDVLPPPCEKENSTAYVDLWDSYPFTIDSISCDSPDQSDQLTCRASGPIGAEIAFHLIAKGDGTNRAYFLQWQIVTWPRSLCASKSSELFAAWSQGTLATIPKTCTRISAIAKLAEIPPSPYTDQGCALSEIHAGFSTCVLATADKLLEMYVTSNGDFGYLIVQPRCSMSYVELATAIADSWKRGIDAPVLGPCMKAPLTAPAPVPVSTPLDCPARSRPETDNGGITCYLAVPAGTIALGIGGAFGFPTRVNASLNTFTTSTGPTTTQPSATTSNTATTSSSA